MTKKELKCRIPTTDDWYPTRYDKTVELHGNITKEINI